MSGQPTSHVLQRVQDLLAARKVPFELSSHRPVFTSAQAAEVRGEPLHSGAKALIVKAEASFVMLVIPGDHQLDNKAAKQLLHAKNVRFATREEVMQISGLQPGSIPPFGSLFGLTTWCDESLGENERINFNAGSHTQSICMTYRDYLAAEQPHVGAFSRPAGTAKG